jgi:two-component system, NtrC family, sensor kinase
VASATVQSGVPARGLRRWRNWRSLQPRRWPTLRAKGIIALLALVLYEVCLGLYVGHERARLLHIVQQLEYTNREHDLLIHVNDGLTHSIVGLQQSLDSGDPAAVITPVRLDLAALAGSLPGFKETHPELAAYVLRFEQLLAALGTEPMAETLTGLRDTEQELAARVSRLQLESEQQDRDLTLHFQGLNHQITRVLVIANIVGLSCFALAVTLFFAKLARDIKQLQGRALAVMGEDGMEPVELKRRDEVGGLMETMNRMQRELQRQEQLQEVSRQRRFHQEKMAAVGAVAATLAHEIGNPINSISGIAQHSIDAIRSGQRLDDQTLLANAELTVRQTERIGAIVRHLSDLSAPRPSEPELLNLNELVQTTCDFVRYDKRLRRAELALDLDRSLPAVRAVADHLMQVLMNLLINAADALENTADRRPTIRVSSRLVDREVVLSVQDNGHGMDACVLAQAFKRAFTTKPAGKGRGIGLYLCKRLVEEAGGRIELESTPGAGTTASVRLRLDAACLQA